MAISLNQQTCNGRRQHDVHENATNIAFRCADSFLFLSQHYYVSTYVLHTYFENTKENEEITWMHQQPSQEFFSKNSLPAGIYLLALFEFIDNCCVFCECRKFILDAVAPQSGLRSCPQN